MNALVEERIQSITTRSERAERHPATPTAPNPVWGVLMVSASLGFGVIALMMAPTFYVKLVASHRGLPAYTVGNTGGHGGAVVDPAGMLRGKAL